MTSLFYASTILTIKLSQMAKRHQFGTCYLGLSYEDSGSPIFWARCPWDLRKSMLSVNTSILISYGGIKTIKADKIILGFQTYTL